MGTYDGGQSPVDSTNWKLSSGTGKDGEEHPAPAPMRQTGGGMKREVTPDPYTQDGSHVTRNFGRRR